MMVDDVRAAICRSRDALLGHVPEWITPNGLTLARLVFALPLMVALCAGRRDIASFIFVLGTVTDALDGPLARSRAVAGKGIGKILDPIVDKFFFLVPLVWLLATGAYTSPWLVLFLSLEGSIATLGIMEFARGKWNPLACTGANMFGKLKTGCEALFIGALIAAPLVALPDGALDVLLLGACIFGGANVASRVWGLRRQRVFAA